RFAVASLVAFTAVGVALAFLVSDQLRTRQEEAAKYQAVFATNSILRYELAPRDLAAPVDPRSPRYRTLSDLIGARLLIAPVVRVKIWRSHGTMFFSDEPRPL